MLHPAPSRTLLAAVVTALLSATPAFAQSGDDARFSVRLSAFQPEASLRLSGEGTATNGTDTTTFDDGATLELGRETRPRGAVEFRMSERQRLIGNFYDYERDENWDWEGGLFDPGDQGLPGDPVDVPAGSVDAELKFQLASLNYEYAVVDTGTVMWGLGLGVTHARIEGVVAGATPGSTDVDGDSGRADWKKSEWSPNLHTRVSWMPTEKWRFSVEGQYLDAGWGDLIEEDGHFERGGLLAEYLISDRIGVHIGYDWFRLEMGDRFEGSVGPYEDPAVDRIDYDGKLTGTLKVHGPMAGVTFRF